MTSQQVLSNEDEDITEFILNAQQNAKDEREFFELIPYDRLVKVNYLTKGGFSTIHKAIWLDGPIVNWNHSKKQGERSNKKTDVILKSFNNPSNLYESLKEWKYHHDCYKRSHSNLIQLYGITRNPNNLEYNMVMKYANKGSLRESLPNIATFSWDKKVELLCNIITGLDAIHQSGFVHCDLHDGNILINSNPTSNYISDLGLCKPKNYHQLSTNNSDSIYGVLPYTAPEVLRGSPYTPASDIYSFSMIMWEIITGISPFYNIAHDFELSLKICLGERPKIPENIPSYYIDLMERCWDSNPLNRPTAEDVKKIIERFDSEEFWNAEVDWVSSNKENFHKSQTLNNISKTISREIIVNHMIKTNYCSQVYFFPLR